MRSPFGWDYPPGVTGNEPEIAGHPDDDELECETCGDTPAHPCVKERSIQYEEGGVSFDAPTSAGTLCEECRVEEEADLASDWD